MVAAKALQVGMEVIVNSGPYRGHKATVLSTEVYPDGHPEQRKLDVSIEGVGDVPIIPKQLSIAGMMAPTKSPSASRHVVVSERTPIESLDDPALDAWRPKRASILKEYVSRTLPDGKTDIDVLLTLWRDARDDNGYAPNVGLVGDTSTGKTMLVEVMAYKVAAEMGLKKPLPVFTLSGSNTITDYDMFGQYRPDENGDLVWMEGIVAFACRVGGILYIDECNAMPGNVTSALHPLCDDRRQFVNIRKPADDGHGGKIAEITDMSRDLWIVATYNPGYAGMAKGNEAFLGRFEWLSWGYDDEVEKRLIKSPAIRLLGQALRTARDNRAIATPVGTSSLQRMERNVALFGVEFAIWALCSKFTNKAERTVVETLIEDRSIRAMLLAEASPAQETNE